MLSDVEPALASTGARRGARSGFRADIDGLRAVAILMVVAYHVDVQVLPGGFVGVDVFFVISGFLITGKLLEEVTATSSVGLRSFWAGRVRRLVPALALMVGVVLVASLFVLGPNEWLRSANEGIASVLYVSNLVFAYQATNYFAADPSSSLFLHTWSLGVEEQFYLVWPVLLLVIARLAHRVRRGRASSVSMVAAALVAIAIVSFAMAVALTARGTPWSFFSLPTRAWEFAAGGLLVCLARRATPVSARAHGFLGIAGLAMIAAAAYVINDATPFPGVATLLPVAGTMALLFSGDGRGRSPVATVLGHRGPQWLGRVSYAWYLWHWPLMLLAVAALEHDSVGVRTGGVVVALGVAWIARRLVENPIRFSPSLRGRPGRSFAVGSSITVAALVVALVVNVHARRTLDEPFFARLTAAADTDAAFNADATCDTERSPSGVPFCTYGDPQGHPTVMLTGDSHATQWIPALDRAAASLGIRLIVHTRGGCPSVPVTVARSSTRLVPSDGCIAFRDETRRLLGETDPSAVVLANADWDGRILDEGGGRPDQARQLQLWNEALASVVSELQQGGHRVGVVLDNPNNADDPSICMARKRSIEACRPPRDESLRQIGPFNEGQRAALERTAGGRGSVPTLDVVPTLCDAEHCDLEHDGALVYRDAGHLASAYVVQEVPAVTDFLRAVTSPA